MQEVFSEVSKMMNLTKEGKELRKFASKAGVIKTFERIPGDASTRRYYRLGTKNDRFILQVVEPFQKLGDKLDFLEVQAHLSESGVDVPKVYDFDAKMGFVLMEDLGDHTLLHRLKNIGDTQSERDLYKSVIDRLLHMHLMASPKGRSKKIAAFSLEFNFKKLMWEVDFTIEHFYGIHLKREIKPKDRKIMVEGLEEICTILAKEPKVFTHRDFHSRNLMVKDDRIVMIDFQDARMGCQQYDLASVLRDSYYQLEESQVLRLVNYYCRSWEAKGGHKIDRDHFLKIFDLMGVQRNFKAIGSFASFLNRRNNPTYLKYIGNTFENIRRALLRYPEYRQLREVLFHYYYF